MPEASITLATMSPRGRYLGPQGSFSEEAALTLAREQDLVACSSFGLVESLESKEVQRVILPIENTIEGSVNWVLDLLLRNNSSFLIEEELIRLRATIEAEDTAKRGALYYKRFLDMERAVTERRPEVAADLLRGLEDD